MFNFGRKEGKATPEADAVSPARFELGTDESRAAARLRAEQLQDMCTCIRMVVTQLMPGPKAAILTALLEKEKQGEELSADEREVVRLNSVNVTMPDCPLHGRQ